MRFVRRPFLYNGVWYGLGGGLVAWLVVDRRGDRCSADPVQRIAGLYGSDFELRGSGPARRRAAAGGGGGCLGWLGSFIAATRELAGIEPK